MCKSLLGLEGSCFSAVPCLLLSFRLNYRLFAWGNAASASWISLLAIPVLLHFLSIAFYSRLSGLGCSLLTEVSNPYPATAQCMLITLKESYFFGV